VILEAMSVGLPVIATDIGGVREAVRHGREGLVVPARDPDALAAAIASVLDDSARAAEMGRAGCKRAAEEFNYRRMFDGLNAVYSELLDAG
jgi:glycosyltransferase involved in cell wall biosynthesis